MRSCGEQCVFRNAVRARTKDFTSRLRKDHFGKQRLHLLAHNALRNNPPFLDQNHKTKIIDLAHAQRDPTMQGLGRPYIPQPETPMHSGSEDLVSSRSKPSNLLDALERLERGSSVYMRPKLPDWHFLS